MPTLDREATVDALLGGALTLHQPARGEGYRVNVDALILAWFAGQGRRARRAVDLGAGVGSVGLCLMRRDHAERVVFVEREARLCRLCGANVASNGFDGRGEVVCADVSDALALAEVRADLVVCNPPYVAPGRGRPPAVDAGARVGDLAVFARAARHTLGARGRACFVYPAPEATTLLGTLRTAGLEPKRLQMVHADAARPARLVLVEALAAKQGGLVVRPPLVERTHEGPTLEMTGVLSL